MEVGGYFHVYFHLLFLLLHSFPFHLCVVNSCYSVVSLSWLVAKGASRAEDPPSGEHALLAPHKQRGTGGGR